MVNLFQKDHIIMILYPKKDEKHPPEKQDRVCNSCYFEVIFLFFVFLIKLKIYICIDQQTIRNDWPIQENPILGKHYVENERGKFYWSYKIMKNLLDNYPSKTKKNFW